MTDEPEPEKTPWLVLAVIILFGIMLILEVTGVIGS